MHKMLVPLTALALLALLAPPSRQGVAGPQAGPRPAEALQTLIEVKLKCGFNDNGQFVCKNVKKKKHHDNDGDSSSEKHKKSKGNICEGPNDCGAGYRDLDTPSKYGACCEEVKDQTPEQEPKKEPTKEPDVPKSGKCMQVEKMSDLSCSAPFDAYSCGPLENGVMTCCCVK